MSQAGRMSSMIVSIQQGVASMDSPLSLLYGFIMILVIVYANVVPIEIRTFMDSPLGRILSIGWIYVIIETKGWIYGLLTALAFLILLRSSVSTLSANVQEGFEVIEKPRIGKRWFVEKVLGETPVMISTEKVVTSPVQT